jgi:hypothetical protein
MRQFLKTGKGAETRIDAEKVLYPVAVVAVVAILAIL